MKRRRYLATLVGGATVFAGCSDSSSSPIDSPPSNESSRGATSRVTTTEREDTAQAVTDARAELAEAYAYLAEYDVVEDGEPRLTRDHIRGYEKRPVTDPAAVARSEVEAALEGASGERRARLEVLLSVANYTEEKGEEYLYLIAGQIAMFEFKVEVGRGTEALPAARDRAEVAKSHFRKALAYQERAVAQLSAVEERSAVPAVDGFELGREQREQEVVRDQAEMLLVTAVGFGQYARGLLAVTEASAAREKEQWAVAEEQFGVAVEAMATADNALREVRKQGPVYHQRLLSVFVCQTGGWAEGMEYMRRGVVAHRRGDEEQAEAYGAKGAEVLGEMHDRCIPEDGTASPTTTASP